MVIIPREKPVIENLNIYYLDIRKLFEHFQGEIGSGGAFFKSHSAEGAIFFDEDELLNGYFQEKDTVLTGNAAIDHLIQADSDYNYSVSIYKISQEEVYFWSSLPSAEKIYKDLSTDFTDLMGLIKKMRSEKLTGYIDVLIGDGKESGLIFISNGEIIGGSYSWGGEKTNSSQSNLKILIEKTKKSGGIFQVSRIPMKEEKIVNEMGAVSFDDDGKPLKMLGTVQDVTEHKRMDNALRNALKEVEELKNRLEAENVYLRV